MRSSLRDAPSTVSALAALTLFVVWDTSQAGYPLTHWAPGGLIVLALLAIALFAIPPRLAEVPPAVKLALACLAAYTALSFLSIAWATAPGAAWEGANRTLLYLMVFALFSIWPGRSASAALLVCSWTLALIALALYVAIRIDVSQGQSFGALFTGERLSYPVGYPNATAAQWSMAFWPALLLAGAPRLPWWLRGVLAGGAVVLADVALFSQSRGSLYATAVMIVLVFALLPGRLRTFATALPVALAIGATTPLVLRVGDRIQGAHDPRHSVHVAVAAILLAASLAGGTVALGAARETLRPVSPALAAGMRRAVAVLAAAVLIAVLAGGLAVAGNPVTRVRHSWESFEGGYSTAAGGNRLLSGLGSNRYDFYRVALDEFLAHPLVGIGADNYQQQYLMRGRSAETPRYPHSVELRTLSQTGAVGALLAVVGLACALLASGRALRRADPLAGSVAAAALAGFAYWGIHGSVDWFWEFAGLGAPAFALLGIACSLCPRPMGPSRSIPARRGLAGGAPAPVGASAGGGFTGGAPAPEGASARRGGARSLAALGLLGALAVLFTLSAPWLSERQIQSAARIWPHAPLVAYSRLDEAAELNPLSDRAYLVAGSIALRFGDFDRAQRQFSLALRRVPDDAYAALELGAIASEVGDGARALGLLERAERLSPRDPLVRQALRTVRAGGRVDVTALNRSILSNARDLA
jgi:tetratricopeptide (TPR) repeat protein